MTTLEILRHARASIADPDEKWDFNEWSECTCGHIYRSATGTAAKSGRNMGEDSPETVAAFRAIVRMLELPVNGNEEEAYATAVSDATMIRGGVSPGEYRRYGSVEREHALSLIDDAISALEAEYERNRLDVLAQARRIVDNAETPEPSLA